MVFCNKKRRQERTAPKKGHNPYFSRWFSAIKGYYLNKKYLDNRHNPYFSRWFSAIKTEKKLKKHYKVVTILILVDGFLQL